MGFRISSIPQQVGAPRELPSAYTPRQQAREALRRTTYVNGLSLAEISGCGGNCGCKACRTGLNGLGELVQVVT